MALDDAAIDVLFGAARTVWEFDAAPVDDETLQGLYELVKLGPTSANSCPGRFVFVRTAEGKEKLKPALSAGNIDKVMAAPVTVIIAQDPLFYRELPKLFPTQPDVKTWFSGNPDLAEDTASRNSTLQGAYLMMAARAKGLDCGAMSGFDKIKLDRAFFSSSGWKSNFLLNLGWPAAGVKEAMAPRLPKLTFEEATVFA
jgi:3-hydroxypropanoate dehydrogenase